MKLANYTKEFPYNLKLATPIMLGSLGHLTVGLVDDIMIGRIGPVYLAASSLGNSLFFIAMSIGIGFTYGMTPLVAESDGKGNMQKGKKLLQHALILNSAIAIVLSSIMILSKKLLYNIGQPQEVTLLGVPYYEIISISLIPLMIFQTLKQFSDGLSQTKYAMYAIVFTNIVNIVINYCLIYGFWIFPRLELVGAALGTLISRVAMLLFMIILLQNKSKFKPYFRRIGSISSHKMYFFKITKMGVPSSLQVFFEVSLFSGAIIIAGFLGVFPQAANQIAIKLSSVAFILSSGLSMATTIRVGNQKGLKQFSELKRIAFSNMLLIIIIMIGTSIIFSLLKDKLPRIFIDDIIVVELASGLLALVALSQFFDGLQVVLIGCLRGLQDVIVPTILVFIAYWLIGFPTAYYLGTQTNFGAQGIWSGLIISLIVSSVLLFLRFKYLIEKLIKLKKHCKAQV